MTKKLFPGISEQDIVESEKQKQQEQTRKNLESARQKLETKQKEKDFEKKLKLIHRKYNHDIEWIRFKSITFLVVQAISLGLLYGGFLKSTKEYKANDNNYNKNASRISITDIRAGEKNPLTYYVNPLKEFYNIPNLVNGEAIDADVQTRFTDGFHDKRIERATLGWIAILFSAGILYFLDLVHYRKKNYGAYDRSLTKEFYIEPILKAWEEGDLEKVDEIVGNMLGTGKDIDRESKNLGKIIQHLSKEDKTAFEKVLNGDTAVSFNTAVQIMLGHLKSHPQDAKLIFETFDKRSIPDEIKTKYARYIGRERE